MFRQSSYLKRLWTHRVARPCFLWSGAGSRDAVSNAEWMRAYIDLTPKERDLVIFDEFEKEAVLGLQPFVNTLNTTAGGAAFAVALRGDILRLRRRGSVDVKINTASLKALDNVLRKWLSCFLADDALILKTITFSDSSGSMLEFITKNEGVHSVKSLAELKNRLSYGKRCFALFHSKSVLCCCLFGC